MSGAQSSLQCPNGACAFARRVGRPATYRPGTTTCTDCGAALVDASAPGALGAAHAPALPVGALRLPSAPWPPALLAGLVVSALAAAAPYALALAPLPYVDVDAVRSGYFGAVDVTGSMGAFSVVALGIGPFLAGALLVELVALAVPRWRRLRHAGVEGRARLAKASTAAGVVVAALQAWQLVGFLREASGWAADSIAPELWSLGPALVVGATLVAGACVVRLLAAAVDRVGVGNGFVVLLAGAAIVELGGALVALARDLGAGLVLPYVVVVALAALVLAALSAWRVVRPLPDAGSAASPAEPFACRPGAGMVPATAAVSSLWVLAMVGSFTGNYVGDELLARTLIPLVVVAVFVPLCMAWFTNAARIAVLHARLAGRTMAGVDDIAWGVRAVHASQQASWLLNVALVLALVLGRELGFAIDVLLVATLVAVGRDVVDEVRARRTGRLVAVWPFHSFELAVPAVEELRAAGIDVHARSAHYRALLHFFAPWAPVELLVDEQHAERARSIVRSCMERAQR